MTPSLRAAAVATAVLVALAGGLATMGARPSTVVIVIAFAFLPYAGLVCLPWPGGLPMAAGAGSPRVPRRVDSWLVFGLALGAGVVLVVAPPLLSDDLYRFLWDGRVLGHGIDPYRYPPDHPALAHLRDAHWRQVNHPEVPTIYPPLAQALFLVVDRIAHAPEAMKAAALVGHLAGGPLVARIAGDQAPRAMWLYLLNPLLLVESALSGHLDIFVGLALAAAALALARGGVWRAALAACVAAGLKLVGVVFAPILFCRYRVAGLLVVAVTVVIALPVVTAGSEVGATAGFGHYARRWQGNEGAFAVVEIGAGRVVRVLSWVTGSAPYEVHVPSLAPFLSELEGTPFDPDAGRLKEKKPRRVATFQSAYLASMLARLAVVLWVVVFGYVLASRLNPADALRWTLLAALLFAPQIHPWYLLWLLPLELATGRIAGVVWSAAVLVSYSSLDAWVTIREWSEPVGARWVEYGLVGVALLVEARVRKPASLRPSLGPVDTEEDPRRLARTGSVK